MDTPRHDDAAAVIVTRDEILTALDFGDRFWHALLWVSNRFAGLPAYICQPFPRKPDFSATAVVYSIDGLISRAA